MSQLTVSERQKLAELRRRVQKMPPPKIPVVEKKFSIPKAVDRGVFILFFLGAGVAIGWAVRRMMTLDMTFVEFLFPRVYP